MSQSRLLSWLPITCIAVLVALTCYVGVFFIARWQKPWWAYEMHPERSPVSPSDPNFCLSPRSWFATVMYPLRYAVARWRWNSTYRHDLNKHTYTYYGHDGYWHVNVGSHSNIIPAFSQEYFTLSPQLQLDHSVLDRLNDNSPVRLSFNQKVIVDFSGEDRFVAEVTSIEPVP